MKIRYKNNNSMIGTSNKFNTESINEIITIFNGRDFDTDYILKFDVYLENKKQWLDMKEAFKNHDLITDNYNTIFFEQKNDNERKKGYRLT